MRVGQRGINMSRSNQDGKVILLICFALILSFDFLIIADSLFAGRPISTDLLRIAITVVVLYCVWLGQQWAVLLIVLLLGMAGLLGFFVGLRDANSLLLAMAVVYLGSSICLFIPPVRRFRADQRAGRRNGSGAENGKDSKTLQFLDSIDAENEIGKTVAAPARDDHE